MWLACASGGVVPWKRHTTIGVSQISHSAIQQMSSSKNHGVIFRALHRSQSLTRVNSGLAGGGMLMAHTLPQPSSTRSSFANPGGRGEKAQRRQDERSGQEPEHGL